MTATALHEAALCPFTMGPNFLSVEISTTGRVIMIFLIRGSFRGSFKSSTNPEETVYHEWADPKGDAVRTNWQSLQSCAGLSKLQSDFSLSRLTTFVLNYLISHLE